MPQPDQVMALAVPDPDTLDDDLEAHFAKCTEKLGLVPTVLRAFNVLRAFIALYNELTLGDSGLTKLEREMIAVVVSSANRCYDCLSGFFNMSNRVAPAVDMIPNAAYHAMDR